MTLVNISSMGTVPQKLGVGKWKKIGVLAIQKVAKTGNIGKKLLWQAISFTVKREIFESSNFRGISWSVSIRENQNPRNIFLFYLKN